MLDAGAPALARAAEAGADLDDDGSLVLLRTVGAGRTAPGPLPRVRGRSVRAPGAARGAGGRAGHGARPGRPGPVALARGAAGGARRVRRPAHREVLASYRGAWAQRARVEAELTDLVDRARDRTREAELLRLGLAEVERVDPQPDEDVTLADEVERLSHAEDLRTAAAGAHAALVGGDDGTDEGTAVGTIELARRLLEHEGSHDPALAALATRIAEAGYLLADVSTDLAAYLEDLQADPLRLEAAQRRRAELGSLTRSYGSTVAEVLAWADTAGRRLLDLDGGEERIDELREERARLRAELDTLADAADERATRRRRASVRGGVRGAGGPGDGRSRAARGRRAGRRARTARRRQGRDAPGAARGRARSRRWARARPVVSCPASCSPSRSRWPPRPGATRPGTFVFDEVDAGVGGRAAVEVGRRLASLAQGSQVLVVTHLAQVAAFADRHLVVTKSTADGVDVVTESDVRLVTQEDRVRELARMLSGQEDSHAARTHAAELLELSSVGR